MKLLVVVALACACGTSSKQSPPARTQDRDAASAPAAGRATALEAPLPLTDQVFEALMRDALAMFKAMGEAVDAAGGDCGKLADDLQRVMDDRKDFIERGRQYKDAPGMDERAEAWMKGHLTEVMEPMMKVGTAGQKCSADAKFTAVMKRFQALN